MADVLSQAQIDALLNAVRSGEKDSGPSAEKQEKKYQKYDFSSPRKFTKDRIKMLNGIFDNYSRVISSRLNARLRSTCEITVESIEEQRYFEFSNALTEGDVLGMIDVQLKDQMQETPAMLYISTSTALSMMDRMLGGEGAADEDLDDDYGYMIGMVNNKTKRIPLKDVAGKLKTVDPDSQMIKEAKRTGISFGD